MKKKMFAFAIQFLLVMMSCHVVMSLSSNHFTWGSSPNLGPNIGKLNELINLYFL